MMGTNRKLYGYWLLRRPVPPICPCCAAAPGRSSGRRRGGPRRSRRIRRRHPLRRAKGSQARAGFPDAVPTTSSGSAAIFADPPRPHRKCPGANRPVNLLFHAQLSAPAIPSATAEFRRCHLALFRPGRKCCAIIACKARKLFDSRRNCCMNAAIAAFFPDFPDCRTSRAKKRLPTRKSMVNMTYRWWQRHCPADFLWPEV